MLKYIKKTKSFKYNRHTASQLFSFSRNLKGTVEARSSSQTDLDYTNSERILTGMQPSGQLHIGNYLGTLRQWKKFQDSHPAKMCYFFIADLHALSDLFSSRPESQIDPNIKNNTLKNFAIILACGVDPMKSHVYIQSQIPMISELNWIISSIAPLHWLNRMTQFKTKKDKGSTAALYVYPILMAADILLFKGKHIPVGEDQTQHIEFARECVDRINKIADKQVLVKPEPMLSVAPRVMSLHDASVKMSKSDPTEKNKINLLDRSEVIHAKIMKAKTDSLPVVTNDDQRRELANLIQIYAGFKDSTIEGAYKEFEGKKLVDFKKALAEVIIAELLPIQQKFDYLMKDLAYLNDAVDHGRVAVLEEAYKNLKEVKEAFNLISN